MPTAPAPPRPRTAAVTTTAAATAAAGARLSYSWNNSPHPLWRALRGLYDGASRSNVATVSRVPAGQPSLAYLGLPQGQANILQLLEHQRTRAGAGPAQRERIPLTPRDLVAGRWPDADLVLVGAQAHQIAGLPDAHCVTAPFRIHLVVDVPGSPEHLQQQISRRERWEFRRNQRAHQWSLEEDSSPAAFEFFYRRMHIPTMRRRHAERSRTESRAVARHAILDRGTLMFVTQDNTRVAGVLCHWSTDHRTLTTRLLGVLDGNELHYREGAFKALYHLLLQWACRQGVPQVDLFGTEAFVSKGIFQWKRKFAPRVVLPPNHFADKHLRLYVRRDTPATRDFLTANPLITLAPATGAPALTPTYFTDAQRPPRLDLSAACPGLPPPRLIDLDRFLTGLPAPRTRP